MHLRKLISDFNITSKLFWNVQDLVSGFLELQLQSKISKVTMIYVFYFKLHQRQTINLRFILAVCHFLKCVTPSRFGFAIQGKL